MQEFKIVQYKKQQIFFDEESIDRRGRKVVKHMQRSETDEEFFERMTSALSALSAEGWNVVTMNNVMPSFGYASSGLGEIAYAEYFSFLLSKEKA